MLGAMSKDIVRLEEVVQKVFAKFGEIRPFVMLVKDTGPRAVLNASSFFEEGSGRSKDLLAALLRTMIQKEAAIARVYIVSEAWMGTGKADAPIVPPSEQPDRQEVILLSAEGREEGASIWTMEIDRTTNPPTLKPATQLDTADKGITGLKNRFGGLFPPPTKH